MTTNSWLSGGPLPEVLDEFVDQIWSSLISKGGGQHLAGVDAKRSEKESQEKDEAEKSRQEAEKAKAKFTEVLELWDAEHDKEKGNLKGKRGKEPVVAKVRANISEMHTWEDVFALLREAEDHYNNSSKFRNFFRRGTSKSETVEPFVGLIPDSHFTSVICAGIKLILGACSAANKSRKDIIALVESLPGRIDNATQYAELYSSEASLQKVTCWLYVRILSAMESIIALWTKDRSFEFLRPLIRQSTYAPLEIELDDVRKASENVERTIQLCNQRRLAQVADEVRGGQATMYEFKTALKVLFSQQYVNAKWFRDALIQTQQLIVQPSMPRASISIRKILKCLKATYPSLFGSPHTSLQQVLQAGFSMASEDQNQATWAISDPKVYGWFKSQRSRALVINGNCSIQRISPLSFFCALLIEILQSLEPIIVLHHFCGLYTTGNSSEREDFGSSTIIKMLLYQLVTQWRFGELECLSADEAQAFHGSSNITDDFLFSIFSKMIRALPRQQPIFIIIDGINFYETREFLQKTKGLVKKLVKLLGARASVKLLITSTTQILDINKYFENDEKLLVPAEPAPRTMGATSQQLKRRFTFGRSTKR